MGKVFYAFGVVLLLINAAASVWRARDDPQNLAFIFFAYAETSLLFWCSHSLEKLQNDADGSMADQNKRERLKLAVWVLSTALSVTFCYRLSEMMPAVLTVMAWGMALLVSAVGFFTFFVYRPPADEFDDSKIVGEKLEQGFLQIVTE